MSDDAARPPVARRTASRTARRHGLTLHTTAPGAARPAAPAVPGVTDADNPVLGMPLPRGVHIATWTCNGMPLLLAIDSRGECVTGMPVVVRDVTLLAAERERLWEWIEAVDPEAPAEPDRALLLIRNDGSAV